MSSYVTIGIVKNRYKVDNLLLNTFLQEIDKMRVNSCWSKTEIVKLFNMMIPNFYHKETGKYLDAKM